MISKNNRFHGHNSLNYVYRHGKVIRGEFISLRFADSRRDDYRMAVVVSRKVSKSAVVRNRIRRRLYEAVRVRKQRAGVAWKYDLVFSVFDERVANLSTGEVEAILYKLCDKAGI